MSIRKEAMSNQAFLQMKKVYENRKLIVKEWKEQGKKVIGTLGYDVPDELVIAADMMQYRIFSQYDSDFLGMDPYLEFAFPPAVRNQFEKIINGTDNDVIDYLVISNSTDALVRIYYYIREMAVLEPERMIPELYFIDWHFTKFRMHQMRNENTLNEFKKQLEKWRGKEIKDDEIKAAAIICNENRAAMMEMGKLRKVGRINGSEALTIIGAAMYMDKREHTALLRKILADAVNWPIAEGVKVFVTGSAQENLDFYRLVESLGGYVVSEDHDWGDRYWDRYTDINLEPIKAIVDRYMLRSTGTKRAFVSERTEAVCRNAGNCGAEAFIAYTHIYDDAPSWDFPEQKKALEKMGIRSLQLAQLSYREDLDVYLQKKIKSFLSEGRKSE